MEAQNVPDVSAIGLLASGMGAIGAAGLALIGWLNTRIGRLEGKIEVERAERNTSDNELWNRMHEFTTTTNDFREKISAQIAELPKRAELFEWIDRTRAKDH